MNELHQVLDYLHQRIEEEAYTLNKVAATKTARINACKKMCAYIKQHNAINDYINNYNPLKIT